MRRREFVTLAGGAAVAWPFVAQAQQTVPIPHIAYLGASSATNIDPRQIEQFKAGPTENGLIDGQNINVDYLWGEGSSNRLRQHAVDLAKGNFAVIVTAGPQPLRALQCKSSQKLRGENLERECTQAAVHQLHSLDRRCWIGGVLPQAV